MKKFLLISGILMSQLCIDVNAQTEETTNKNTSGTEVVLDVLNFDKKDEPNEYSYLTGLDLGLLLPVEMDATGTPLKSFWKSMDVHWHLFQGRHRLFGGLNFRWGLDMNWRNYRFETGYSSNYLFYKNPTTNKYTYTIDQVNNYTKNKLMARYISVPLMLELRTRKSNDWKEYGISVGVSVGQLINAKQKLVSTQNGKQKKSESFGFSPQKVDLVARFELGAVTIYGNFGLTPMFKASSVEFLPNYTSNSIGIEILGL